MTAADSREGNLPTRAKSSGPNGHTASRSKGNLQILLLGTLLSAFWWTKLFPSAQTLPTLQKLPAGFSNCFKDHFNDIADLVGTKRLALKVDPVIEFTAQHPGQEWIGKTPPFQQDISNLSFCSVTYSYTHIGYNNEVNVTVYLPSTGVWNGRFQGVGGGAFVAGLGAIALHPAVSAGWAAASTDGGLFPLGDPRSLEMCSWALTRGGNIDWNSLHVFGIRAVEDMTLIGQAITKKYYNGTSSGSNFRSYWNGCSTGGRQGLMLAQRAPHLYDGILATAPALDYSTLLLGIGHAQQLMTSNNIFPQPCELSHIHHAAVAACDPLDGVTDGIISSPELCKFSPLSLIGSTIPCPGARGGTTIVSDFAAYLVQEIWRGPRPPTTPDVPFHPGLSPEAPLNTIAHTSCNYTGTSSANESSTCTGLPMFLTTSFMNLLMHLSRDLDLLPLHSESPGFADTPTSAAAEAPLTFPNLTIAQYHALLPLASRDLNPLISAIDNDLSRFATSPKRPKMITWHGLADEVIAAQHSLDYYRAVMHHFELHPAMYVVSSAATKYSPSLANPDNNHQIDKIEKVQDFYRYYQVPGALHCGKGLGPYPGLFLDSRGALDQLVDWVEEGKAPSALNGVSEIREDLLIGGSGDEEVVQGEKKRGHLAWDGRIRRPICSWPERAAWKSTWRHGKVGKWWNAKGWECEKMKMST